MYLPAARGRTKNKARPKGATLRCRTALPCLIMTNSPNSPPLTLTRTSIFWAPLALTWLMMAVEGPLLTAVIARMPDPKLNLAAFGIAFAFALIVEAPVIMMMAASTALVTNRPTYLKLRNFTQALNIGITLTMLVGLVPPVHDWVIGTLLGLGPSVGRLTWLPLALLLPWPAAIGLRRFYQGILIRNGLTRRVAYGTVFRMATMAGATAALVFGTDLDGAAVGAAALSSGVTAEALGAWLLSRRLIKQLLDGRLAQTPIDDTGLHYRSIIDFYTPLALTSFLSLGVQPIVTFFVGHGRAPLESLAVLPVIHALVFIFRSLGLAFQEAAIALFGDHMEGYQTLRRFTVLLGVTVLAGLGLIVWTPLAHWWFHTVAGLSDDLVTFAVPAARILTIMPALTVWISWQRAQLVHFKKTSPITWASALEICGVVAGLVIGILVFDLIGATAAATALVFGRLAANARLIPPIRRLLLRPR